MTAFLVLILLFSAMVQRGRLWVRAQSPTETPVYQPDKELSVDIGGSASLRCCVSEKQIGIIDWFKQPNREKPQIIVTVYKTTKETFYNGFQESRFRTERSSDCFTVTILNLIQSDEAMYYCALQKPHTVFANGTYLKIKGEPVTVSSETSTPARCDHSVVREAPGHGNSTNMNTQENAVRSLLGLGTALASCAIVIFCLMYFILRRKCDKKVDTSIESSPGQRQISEGEALNYAALQFSKRKAKAEKRKTGSSDECVYSNVKLNIPQGS